MSHQPAPPTPTVNSVRNGETGKGEGKGTSKSKARQEQGESNAEQESVTILPIADEERLLQMEAQQREHDYWRPATLQEQAENRRRADAMARWVSDLLEAFDRIGE